MKKFIAFFVLLFSLIISSTVSAENWEFICSGYDSNKIYIDVDSILDVKNLLGINRNGHYVQAIFLIEYSVDGRNSIIETRLAKNQIVTSEMQDLNHMVILCSFKNFGEGEYYNISDAISFTRSGSLIPEMSFVENENYYNIFSEITGGKYELNIDQYFEKTYQRLFGEVRSIDRAQRVAIYMALEYQAERIRKLSNLFNLYGLTNGAINSFGLQCLGMINDENSDVANVYLKSNPISTKNFIPMDNHPLLGALLRHIINGIALKYM